MRVSRSARRAGLNRRIDRGPRGGVSANAAANAATIANTIAVRDAQRIALPSALLAQLLEVRLFGALDESLVAVRIDERVRGTAGALCLLLETEDAAVLGDEHVGRQIAQHTERARVVIGNRRDASVADQVHALVDGDAAHERDLIPPAVLGSVHRPRGAALGVSRREVRGQRRPAERYRVAVFDGAIDVHGRPAGAAKRRQILARLEPLA